MGIVVDATHDVFVSYARINNSPYEDATPGWVTRVVRVLRSDLAQRLGRSDCDIYFDLENHETGQLDRALNEHVSAAACFVFVLSRASVSSRTCVREFNMFLESHPSDFAERLVVVDMDNPLACPGFLADLVEELSGSEAAAMQRVLEACRRQIRIECFRGVAAGRVTPIDHPPEAAGSESRCLFYQKVSDVGEVLTERITAFRRRARSGRAPAAVTPTTTPQTSAAPLSVQSSADTSTSAVARIPVFLALGTMAAREHREEIARFLAEQEQVELRPLNAQQLWPGLRQEEQFKAAVEPLIKSARLFVMLLGGRRPEVAIDSRFAVGAEDLPNGYLTAQLTLAEQNSVKPLLWCSPDVADDTLESAEAAIRTSRSVVEDTLESFKRSIANQVQRVAHAIAAAQRAKAASAGASASVFLNFAEQDRELAEQLVQQYAQRFTLFTPASDASAAEMRELTDDFYRSCDAAIFLDRQAPGRWMDAQLIQFIKVRASRERPIRALAAVRAAARPRPSVSIPDLQLLTVPGAGDSASVSPVLEKVFAAIGA
jgi:TIR domain